MDLDRYIQQLEDAFSVQKDKGREYVDRFNAQLPTSHCPHCQTVGHCPGLNCPDCGYRHHPSWLLARPGEFGTEIVPLNDQKRIVLRLDVEEPQ